MNELIPGTIGAPNDVPADAAGTVTTPNTLPADAAGSVGTPNTLPADNAGIVAAPNTLSADAAGSVATPNTLSADAAGIVAAPISLTSATAAAFPRSLTPMVDFDFAAKRYVQDGAEVAFEDIFTYTRASSATFTNRRAKKNGGYEYFLDTDYVGSVENLLTYSEDLTDADWIKSSASTLGNQIENPIDGVKNADKLVENTATTDHKMQQDPTFLASTTYTLSFYAKKAERDIVRINIFNGSVSSPTNFNLNSGTITLSDTATAAIVDAGNGWYRCSLTATMAATGSPNIRIYIVKQDGNATYTGDGVSGIYVWGAQLTTNAKALPYVKTLDVAVTKTFAETLRTEYNAVTGENLGALIEGGSTNLMIQSENIDLWSVVDEVPKPSTYTRTPNYGLAPDSTMSATRVSGSLFDTTSGSSLRFRNNPTVVNGSDCSLSFWVKSLGPNYSAQFHFQGGQVGSIVMTNEWQRVSYSALAATTTLYVGISLRGDTAGTTAFDFLIWGGQLEELPFVSSYIRTEGAAVSRSSDALSVNSFNFNNEEFSVVADFSKPYIVAQGGSSSYVWTVNEGLNVDRIINILTNKKIRTLNTDNGSNTADFSSSFDLLGGNVPYSNVVTFKNSGINGYLNGALYGSDSTTPVNNTNFDNFNIGTNLNGLSALNGHISKLSTYAQALTQQEITLL